MGEAVRLWRGPRHGELMAVDGPYLKVYRIQDPGPRGLEPVFPASKVDTEAGYYTPNGHTDGYGYEIWQWGGWQ